MAGRPDAWPGWTDVAVNLTVEGRAAEKRVRERSFSLWTIMDDEEDKDAAKVASKGLKDASVVLEHRICEKVEKDLAKQLTNLDEKMTPSVGLQTSTQQSNGNGENHTSATCCHSCNSPPQ